MADPRLSEDKPKRKPRKKASPKLKAKQVIDEGIAPKPSAPVVAPRPAARKLSGGTINPRYRNVQVKLVTVRRQFGFETGIGVKGNIVASKDMSWSEAQALITKIVNRWGKTITPKIPNIGLDTDQATDEQDYDKMDRRSAGYNMQKNEATGTVKFKDTIPREQRTKPVTTTKTNADGSLDFT